MRHGEPAEASVRGRKPNGHHQDPGHRFAGKTSMKNALKLGRGLPRRLMRDIEAHPEATLATIGGASFVAGMVLGSRIGRAILAAMIPSGIQYLFASELGPRLVAYVEDLIGRASNDTTPV
jgi:hypothetical protein